MVRTNRSKYSENNSVLPGIRRVQIEGKLCAGVPTISQVLLTSANTEVSFAFPAGTSMFRIKARGGQKFTIAYTAGGNVYTIPKKNEYCLTDICADDVTIFLQSPKDSVTIEIESWQSA